MRKSTHHLVLLFTLFVSYLVEQCSSYKVPSVESVFVPFPTQAYYYVTGALVARFSDNSYVVAYHVSSQSTFMGTKYTHPKTSCGLVMYDKGNTVVWGKLLNDAPNVKTGNQCNSIHITASNRLYIGGQYQSTLMLGAKTLTSLTETGNDAFLVEVNRATGVPVWSMAVGSTSNLESISAITSTSTHLYFCGNINGVSTLEGVQLTNKQKDAIFLKYTLDGVRVDHKLYGGTKEDNCASIGVTADGNNILLGLNTKSKYRFWDPNSQTSDLTSTFSDFSVLRLNSALEVTHEFRFSADGQAEQLVRNIYITSSQKAIVVGKLSRNSPISNLRADGTTIAIPKLSGSHMVVCLLEPNNLDRNWCQVDGSGSSQDLVQAMEDPLDDKLFYLGGIVTSVNPVLFDTGFESEYLTKKNSENLYLGKMNIQNGSVIWQIAISTASFSHMAADNQGNIKIVTRWPSPSKLHNVTIPSSTVLMNVRQDFDKCGQYNELQEEVCSKRGKCTDSGCACDSPYAVSSGLDLCLTQCYSVLETNSSVCSGHGNCTNFDICTCSSGYIGNMCETVECFGVSGSLTCSGHGVCDSPDVCSCNNGYTGSKCEEEVKCYGKLQNATSVCSGQGQCIAIDSCNCTLGYSGDECEVQENKFCFGIEAKNSSVCSGHGECVETDSCNCSTSYGGEECQYLICDGILSNDTLVCSGHGTCIAPNTCSCQKGWLNSDCSSPICFQVDSTSNSVCSGRGKCIVPDYCKCKQGYGGYICQRQCPTCHLNYKL